MKRFLFICTAFIFFISFIRFFVQEEYPLYASEDNYSTEREYVVIRFHDPSSELIEYVLDNEYEIVLQVIGEYLDILIMNDVLPDFIRLGWEYEIQFTESEMRENLVLKTRTTTGYRDYQMVLDELTNIAVNNPEIAMLYNIGDSRGKEYFTAGNTYYENFSHDIWAIKITADPQLDHDRPGVYYNGAQHAREPISAEVTMLILCHLIDNYGTDPEITFLVDNTEIWFIPLMNPDGHKIVIDQTNTNWRKNIRDNNNTGVINTGDGVDLNRNYTHQWQYSSHSQTATYGGPFPSSEPETTALRNLWQQRHFVAGISYHSYGQWVLFPPGYVSGLISPDVQAQAALATAMAVTIPRINGAGHYTPQHSWQLYPARGTCEDDAYCNHGIFAYTFELATVFIPPEAQMQQICEDNLEAALILLRRVHHSTLTGIMSNYETEEPVVAEVFIPGIDDTGVWRTPYLSSEAYGRYYRLLLPGEYSVQFSSAGYHQPPPVFFSINDSTQTVLNYELLPLMIPSVSGYGADDFVLLTWELPYSLEEPERFNDRSGISRSASLTSRPGQREFAELPYPVSFPLGYRIYRNETLLNPDSLLTSNFYFDFDISGSSGGQEYQYQVTALFPEGESEFSELLTITPQEGNLVLSENTLISLSEANIILSWSPIDNAIVYLVYTSSDPYTEEEWLLTEITTETEWTKVIDRPIGFFQVKAIVEND